QESQSEAEAEGPVPVPAEEDSEQGDDTSQPSESPLLIHLSPGTSDQIFRAWAQMAELEILSISSPSSSGSRSPFSSGLDSPIPFEQRSFGSSHSSSSTPVNPASATPSLIESDAPSESEPSISSKPTLSSLFGSESPAVSDLASSTSSGPWPAVAAESGPAAPAHLESLVPRVEHCFAFTTGTQKKGPHHKWTAAWSKLKNLW